MVQTTDNAGHPALTDPQTGLPNRLHWDTVFRAVYAAGERGIPLTLLLLELGRYPAWAREKTPGEVDQAFSFLGQAIVSTSREADLVARTHADRFSFLLLDCNLAGGRLVADRIGDVIEPLRRLSGLSFNMGVAAYHRDMKGKLDLMAAAEGALRTAQARGENENEFHG